MTAGKGEKRASKPEAPAAERSVETIRDILFGGQVREIHDRLEALGRRLDALDGRLDEATANLRSEAREGFEELRRDLARETEARETASSALAGQLAETLEARVGELSAGQTGLQKAQEDGHARAERAQRQDRADLARLFRQLAASIDGEGDA